MPLFKRKNKGYLLKKSTRGSYVVRRKAGLVYTPAYPRNVGRTPFLPSGGSLGKKIFGASPFPAQKICKMYYAETFLLASGTAGIVGPEQVLRLNSLYDVNFTGTGSQPYGYDQCVALYRKYVVDAVTVKITWYDPNAEGMIAIVTMQPSGSSATLTGQGIDALQMQPMTWTKYIPTTGGQQKVFKQYMKIHKLEGITKTQFDGELDEYGAVYTTNPTNTPYIRLAVAAARGDTATNIIAKAELTFHTRWYDRIPLGPS